MQTFYSPLAKFTFIAIVSLFASCGQPKTISEKNNDFNKLAEQYVRLGLAIGQYDPVFIDAYYGPDSLKPASASGIGKVFMMNSTRTLCSFAWITVSLFCLQG